MVYLNNTTTRDVKGF